MSEASEMARYENLPAGTYMESLTSWRPEVNSVPQVHCPGNRVADTIRTMMDMYEVPLVEITVWRKI